MWDKREPLLSKRYNNNKAALAKSRKKSNITLAIDAEIQDTLKNIAEGEGLSINSKINSVLWKYITFYKYVEQDRSLIIPSRSVHFFIQNIDEDKWIEEYIYTLEEIVPFFFIELKTPQTLENTLKVVFDRLLAYGGSYKGYSCQVDKDGNMNLVFQHDYGIKWSRILSEVYTRFIQKTLNQPAYPLNISETWFAIRLPERTEKLDEMRI
ncbi:MAG TPA: hypothetical protein VHG34_01810 [Nitrososphaeraceae archaeon]|nr:hypothetical protein [Nitrososphaeraceae archaeon]